MCLVESVHQFGMAGRKGYGDINLAVLGTADIWLATADIVAFHSRDSMGRLLFEGRSCNSIS